MSKTINHPIARYNMREKNSYLPVKNNFFKVPIIDKTNTEIKIFIPEWLYIVIKHTGA